MIQLDLFAGIGGISLAAQWAGIETVAFCEKESFCQSVLRHRFPGRPIYDDVFNLTREVLESDGIISRERGIDIIAGGFPCQPFSHAGKRKGTGDDRYLWPEMRRIIGEVRPTWVFAENVDGLVSMAQSDWEPVMEDETTICEEAEMVIETIRKDLKNEGYQSIPVIVPACGVGAAHRRYRIFILGYSEHDGSYGTKIGRGVDQASDNNEKRTNKACQSEGAGGRENGTIVGYSKRSGCSGQSWGRPREESSDGHRKLEKGVLAHTKGKRVQRIGPDRVKFVEARYKKGKFESNGYGTGQQRPTQPRLGGSPYELSDWLDGFGMNPLDALINFIASYPQPALMGQGQYDWEPPRVAQGVKNRTARIKALGNAVNPLQALPILYGIRVMHDFYQKD